MEVLVQELLEEDVAKVEAITTKAKEKARAKANPSQKARILERKARTRARLTPNNANFATSMATGHVNVLTGWFNKLSKVILLNFLKYQFNLLAKEFNNSKFDILLNQAILPLHRLQRCAESSRSLWECLH